MLDAGKELGHRELVIPSFVVLSLVIRSLGTIVTIETQGWSKLHSDRGYLCRLPNDDGDIYFLGGTDATFVMSL